MPPFPRVRLPKDRNQGQSESHLQRCLARLKNKRRKKIKEVRLAPEGTAVSYNVSVSSTHPHNRGNGIRGINPLYDISRVWPQPPKMHDSKQVAGAAAGLFASLLSLQLSRTTSHSAFYFFIYCVEFWNAPQRGWDGLASLRGGQEAAASDMDGRYCILGFSALNLILESLGK